MGVIFALLLSACVPKAQQETARKNLSFLYNPSSNPLHPEFVVYHESQFFSRLYIKLFPVELLFNQANTEGTYQSRVRITYQLRELIDGKESELLSDSASHVFTLRMDEAKNVFVANISLDTRPDRQYNLKVNTTDLLRGRGTVNYIHVDRSSENVAQNYFVRTLPSGIPAFEPVFTSGEFFNISANRVTGDSLYVKYYENDFPLPRPPVTNLNSPQPDYKVDSFWTFPYSDTLKYNLPYEGMYMVQLDPGQEGGLPLFNFGENYPRVVTVDDMIGPLAYLSSSTDFNDLANQNNKKLAIDNFWLQSASNVQSAREMIRVYYNRVFFANYFFTSYKEGWKTDRGMMFIVYGPPNVLTKRGETEIWVYYRKKSSAPLQFTFSRHENPYSHNDYRLERNFVNSMWVQAVQDWRKGKIFFSESH